MKIKSFEQGCEIMGCDPALLPIVDHLPARHQKAQIASYKLSIISEASWKGDKKVIDWNNRTQYKWYPYWWINEPGFRFYVSYCAFSLARATGGSRFVYPSEKDSDYHAKEYKGLYEDLYVIPAE